MIKIVSCLNGGLNNIPFQEYTNVNGLNTRPVYNSDLQCIEQFLFSLGLWKSFAFVIVAAADVVNVVVDGGAVAVVDGGAVALVGVHVSSFL